MAEDYVIDLELIKKRAISGVVTFTLRTFFIQVFTFFATFLLTILLDPSIFGIFFVVSAFINFFVYFSDIGLAAALIQKKEEPTKEDFKTTFTIQQSLVFTLVIIGFIFSAKIASFYNLNHDGLVLLRVLIFSLLLSSLKTIPSIVLERKLNFTRLVIPQVAENIVFYTTALVLAFAQFGLASFTWAVLARGVVGLIIIYLLSPWRPQLGIKKESAKTLSSFGFPFQVNSLLALLKDDLLIIFLGKILTFTQVGYIGWAQKWAYLPLRFFMDSVSKVTFPTYSRLQEQRDALAKAIEKSLFFVTYLVYPSVFGLSAIAPYVLNIVPNYSKWQGALPLLYLFAINSAFSAVSTTFTNTLFAIGKPKIVLKLMVFWTTATWLLTYPLIIKFGYIGVGMASAIVAVTSIATVYYVKKEIPVRVAKSILSPLLISSIMFIVVKSIGNLIATDLLGLIITIICGVIIYLAISFTVLKKNLIEDTKVILSSLIAKR